LNKLELHSVFSKSFFIFFFLNLLFLDALAGSSSTDLLGSTSGYHSYEPSPFNHRSKRSSLLDPSAAEFQMEIEPALGSNRSSFQSDQQIRRSSRSQSHTPSRIATSCKNILLKNEN